MKLEYTATLELSLVSQLLRPGSVFLQSKRASSGMGIKCFLSFGGHHWLHERGRGRVARSQLEVIFDTSCGCRLGIIEGDIPRALRELSSRQSEADNCSYSLAGWH